MFEHEWTRNFSKKIILLVLELFQERLDCSESLNFERYLEYWCAEGAKQFPRRPVKTLVIHCSGKSVCVTRFFRPLPLPGKHIRLHGRRRNDIIRGTISTPSACGWFFIYLFFFYLQRFPTMYRTPLWKWSPDSCRSYPSSTATFCSSAVSTSG